MAVAGWFEGMGFTAAGYILPFLFVLTIVVFFHELGHFLVARWCGVAVKTFSVGFGPELVGWTDRTGTRWRISLIPLGGYVRFLGDETDFSASDPAAVAALSPEDQARTFAAKGLLARAAIVAAGPVANFILAIIIFAAIFGIMGRQSISARVDSVVAGSAAAQAGFEPGDIIVSIDGSPVKTFSDLQQVVGFRAGQALHFTVERAGKDLPLTATPVANRDGIGILGIARDPKATDIVTEHYSPPAAVWLGISETWFIADRTLSYLGGVVTGHQSPAQLGGPIRVAEVAAQVASIGIVALINLAAVLSVSIGLINLFPIPMLDGGHLLYFLAEAIRGRPLSDRVQDIGFRVGLAAVLMLMIFATWNDIIHLSSL